MSNKIKLIPKNQNASRPVKTRLQIRDEQLQLWDSGAFEGVLKNGKPITYEQAVDGLDEKLTNLARDNYKKITERNVSMLQNNSASQNAPVYVPWTPTLRRGENCGVEGCAKYANDTLKEYKDGKGRRLYSSENIGGHAWTRLTAGKNNKMIYSGYEGTEYDTSNPKDREIYLKYLRAVSNKDKESADYYASLLKASVGNLSVKRNKAAADRFMREFDSSTLDKNKTYMVNMYYSGSPNTGVAWYGAENGTTGTHTGNVYWDSKTGRWRISHNVHGIIKDDDFIQTLGSRRPYAVTAIAEAVANDYTEADRRDDYRLRKPIRGWVRDKLGIWKKGGRLIPKAKSGLPVTYDVPVKSNGDWDYNTATPEGYDLSSIGITRTYDGLKTYGNSDSLPIANSLIYINDRLPDLANRYDLSIDEARMLMGDSQAVMWNESGGGSSKKVNPRTNEVVESHAYNSKDNNPVYMFGVRTVNGLLGRDTSEGYGRVKVKDLRDLPNYSSETEQELSSYAKRTPHFSGLSTFASMALRYNKLKEMFKDDNHLIFGEDGALNELGHALLFTSHNLGFNNIQKNYDKYKLSGDINELEQYKGFRYPKLSLLLIRGHNVAESKPTQLRELVVTPNNN